MQQYSNFLLNKHNFCRVNYSREESIQGQKLYEEIQYFKESWENGDAWIAWLLLQKELCTVVSQSLLGSFLIQMVKKGHLDTHSTHKNTAAILLHTAVVGGVIFQTNAEMFIFGYLNVEFYVRWGILG